MLYNQFSSVVPAVEGAQKSTFTVEELASEVNKELALQQVDRDIRAVLAQRNVLESFILESRQATSNRKHGHLIAGADKAKLESILNDAEDWLYNECVASDISVSDISNKVGIFVIYVFLCIL